VHLLQRVNGLSEILERGAAQQEIEGVVLKRHAGGVALAELDIDARIRGVPLGDLDKRVADVESSNFASSMPK
jgi:hypothetical protein